MSRKEYQLEGFERKYCTNVTGKRQTKCGCYKKGQPCTRPYACYLCGNKYGQREGDSDLGDVRRKRKMTSSPPSLKRTRMTTFLKNNGFEVQHGQWTPEETCLFDTIESFLYATGILASCKNIATLFNFVVKSLCATNLNLTANTKTVKQIQGKMAFVQNRQAALENLTLTNESCLLYII